MKFWILTASLLATLNTWAKPSVLLTYYDSFGRAPFNNSEMVALEIQKRFISKGTPINLKLCKLNTVFDKAYFQTEDCIKSMNEAPDLVLGLGEAFCEMKVETLMVNRDNTVGADNDGNERKNALIIAEGPKKIGLNYPIEKMYCALDKKTRKSFNISTYAGAFVCNNTSYQMSYNYPEISHGFIHVPAHNCKDLEKKTKIATDAIEKLITNSAAYTQGQIKTLPTTSNEVAARKKSADTKCEEDFFKQMKLKD